jgi:hypothetical protein
MKAWSVLAMAGTLLAAACGGEDRGSQVQAPGSKESAKTAVLEKGADVLQNKPPIEALNAYLDGFHFYSGNMKEQMEAHHYCSIVNEDLTQCVIFDGNTANAKIMGVEYIVSEKLFKTLPPQEKPLWHSHVYEVKSGQLVAPGIPTPAEKALMKKLVTTYGKTWHTWHTDLHKDLPIGVPQLMMGFTADGQTDPAMVAARDRAMGISSEKKREERADIVTPAIDPGADAWQTNPPLQIADPTGTETRDPHGAQRPNRVAPTSN